jgi:hypothetical protein
MKINTILLSFFLLMNSLASAQFPPGVGQAGTTAIHKDSAIFVGWANKCTVERGFVNISNPSLGFANSGLPEMAIGEPGTSGLVSLGDAGSAVLTFKAAIFNGPGWDFAVFENGFDGFLELAFVEVSSDGINFFRFPATSLTETNIQTGTFGLTDPTKINNLAGKYDLFYGTPFDLEELKDEPGLDVNNITHVKIIDVVGSIDVLYGSKDDAGRMINDPFPTPFPQSGFDLDAVGVIHQKPLSVHKQVHEKSFSVYPQPANGVLNIKNLSLSKDYNFMLVDFTGKLVHSGHGSGHSKIDVSFLQNGWYVLHINGFDFNHTYKIVIGNVNN